MNFAATEEIQDFTTISDTDLKELLNPTNFITNNQVLAKNQKKMTFPVETEENPTRSTLRRGHSSNSNRRAKFQSFGLFNR